MVTLMNSESSSINKKLMRGVYMGFTIFYFSATGNSLEITTKIAKELGYCTIKSMAAQMPSEPVGGPGESIGFVFPVFYNGLPRLVKRFIEKLAIFPETYCFAITNSGGTRANPLGMLEDILTEKGIRLSYADEVKMPGNYIVSHQAPASDKVQKIINAAAGKNTVHVCPQITGRCPGIG